MVNLNFEYFAVTNIQSNYYRTNFFAQKTMKNTEGMPSGRGHAAPESGVQQVLLQR